MNSLSNAIIKGATPKKLIIKNFKGTLAIALFVVKPTLPENYFENTINQLLKAVEAIHTLQSVPDSLEELYKVSPRNANTRSKRPAKISVITKKPQCCLSNF